MRFQAYSYINISDIIENAVSSFRTEYYQSTSNTELIGGSWSITIPPWINGRYYWQKTITTFSDPNKDPVETKPVCITGGVGSDGRGIKSISAEYAKNTSNTLPPTSGWNIARPSNWKFGEYIWTRFKIVYNDNSQPEYTTPTCDSSWEAMNNLEIGGRNLLKNTSSIVGYKDDQRNWIWSNWGTVSTNTIDNVTDSIHIVTQGADIDNNSGIAFSTNDIHYKKGERYTFSIAIRGTYNLTDKFGSKIYYSSPSGNKFDEESTSSWIDNQDGINDGISSVVFKRRFISFTIPDDFDESKNIIKIVIYCKKMDILLCRPQLEKGNKPTDWKRAEEDIQEQFVSVIKTLSGVSSKVDTVEGKITNKVWQTDINNAVNNYDGTTIESIRDKVSQQEQTINGFNQTVKDMQTTIEKKADGSSVETLKNNVSSLTQDLSGFKTTVSQTYITNDNLKTNYFNKSETQQLADRIYWIVSDTSSSSSLTLTSQALTAMTNQLVVKSPDGKRVIIQKGQILLDALMSNNYSAPTSSTGVYASAGTFYNLSNGSIISKNFVIDENGNSYIKGTINATAGIIGGCSISNGKLIVPAANISGTLSADKIIVGSGNLTSSINNINTQITSVGNTANKAISSTQEEFYSSSSPTSLLGGSWSSTQPVWQQGKYIWRRTKIVYADENKSPTYEPSSTGVCITGNTGNQGTSVSITSKSVTYQSSSSGTTTPTGNWSNNIPSIGKGQFLWTKTTVNYSDGNSTTSYSVAYQGINGTNGTNGKDGINGKDGKDANQLVHSVSGAGNTNMYINFATIKITSSYINYAISFRVNSRGYESSDVQIMFNSINGTDPSLAYFRANGGVPLWIVKTATSTWNIIMKKNEAYGSCAITNYYNPLSGVTVNWTSTQIASLPSGVVTTDVLAEARTALDWCYNNNKTYIDGGKIYANTVAANQIAAGAIVTDKIATGAVSSVKIAANAITSDKITTSNISGTGGWINLRNGTFNYGNGKLAWNGSALTLNGSGTFSGNITANSLTLGSSVAIPSGNISGLSKVATSGSYNDLGSKPNLSVYISKDGTIGSTPANGATGFKVSSNGLLSASNAIIYGTIYATAGTIGGCSITNGKLTVPTANISGTLSADKIIVGTSNLNTQWNTMTTKVNNVQTAANDAAKTASSFIKADSNGIIVADQTKTTLGNNVLIDSDSVDIRNGTSVLSSFGANTIELGKNSTSTTIKMCNGYATMSIVDEGFTYNPFVLSAPCVEIKGNETRISSTDNDSYNVLVSGVESSMNGSSAGFFGGFSVVFGQATIQAYDKTTDNDNMWWVRPTNSETNHSIISRMYVQADRGFSCNQCIDGFANQELWTGALWPSDTQTVTFSSPVSAQPHGIILVFSDYNNGSATNSNWVSFFVPKGLVKFYDGNGHLFLLSSGNLSVLGRKYIYIYDGKLVGTKDNSATGTGAAGPKYTNNRFVLRRVFGV